MAMDEVERYQKLLEDWSWSGKPPAGKQGPGAPQAPASAPVSAPIASNQPAPTPGPHLPGAILCVDGATLAVYKQPVPGKDYHLALVMLPNGSVKTQGIGLAGHEVDEIGTLPAEMMERLGRDLRWSRDLIVFHCYSYADVAKIPQNVVPPAAIATPDRPTGERPMSQQEALSQATSSQGAAKPQGPVQSPPAPTREESTAPGVLRRGQRLQVRFGDKLWDAVYWGKDDKGQVVAHKTNKDWSLMHLDLTRFGGDLNVDTNIDPELVAQIEASITKK